MAKLPSVSSAARSASPFRSNLPADARENIVALAESVQTNATAPYQALSVLLELLRKMELTGTVPVWGLVSLMDPLLAQLDLVCADAATLSAQLSHSNTTAGGSPCLQS